MSETDTQNRAGRVAFTGSRHELAGIVVRGYGLMVPTIGLYRFWQATWKRRFYWQNTVIDGDPLEYTGTPAQLLIGFFFALAFFLPIYIAAFYLSMQDTNLVLVGYAGVGAIVWFLSGYAIYRARDFRLSRTLWRGVRFDQKGNAWAYALRRFLWSIAMVCTAGLIYPWMASSLWRYRYRHTWFGDRKFDIAGNWRVIAGPYYGMLALNVLAGGFTVGWIASTHDVMGASGVVLPGPIGLALCAGSALVLLASYCWYHSRTASRMLSTVTIGEARLETRISAGRLLGQYLSYGASVVVLLLVLGGTALLALGGIVAAAMASGEAPDALSFVTMFQSGTLNVVLLIGVYLIVLAAFGLLSEVILGFGWWALLARSSRIINPDSLRSVRAGTEDRALIGEGLADALNVGAY